MARSETDSNEESSDSLVRLKNKVSGLSKTKLKEFLLVLIGASKNSGSGQIRVGQFRQRQNSDEKLMSDTPFFRVGQFGRG